MARPLAVIAVTGIAVSFICLSLASALHPGTGFPYPFSHRSWSNVIPWQKGPPFVESGDIVTRDFRWSGGNTADISIPGVVYFTPGPNWQVTVTGRESSLDHLQINDGRIYFDAPGVLDDTSSLEMRITGPSLQHIGLNGSGKLLLENLNQQSIEINIRGSGTVHGTGTVRSMELQIFGSGNADLGQLEVVDVDTSIFGSGNAEIAPTGNVDVLIFGSGDVRLRTRPNQLSSRVTGSGRVVQLTATSDQP